MAAVSRPITQRGALIEVRIGPSALLAQQLQHSGTSVPPPIAVAGLVDTGASNSVLSASLPGRLSLSPVGARPVTTITTIGSTAYLYQISVELPNLVVEFLVVPAAVHDFGGFDYLIGRDILNAGRLHYDGPGGVSTLEF